MITPAEVQVIQQKLIMLYIAECGPAVLASQLYNANQFIIAYNDLEYFIRELRGD